MPPKKGFSHKKKPPKKGSTSKTIQPDCLKEKNAEKEHENVCDLSQEQNDEESVKRKYDVGSKEKIDENTREPKMRKLSCSCPNSSEQVDFDITQECNVHKNFYEIHSSPPMTPADYYIIKKYNEGNYFLNFEPFNYTLDEWLSGQKDIWCPVYKQWGEYHPNEELRKVLQGMILAVCVLHEREEFHGALDCLENYALRFIECYAGEEETGIVEVTLLHRSPGTNTNINSSEFGDQNVVTDEGIKKDMGDLCTIIFDKILKVKNLQIAEDLKELHMLMANNYSIKDINDNRCYIASHPSLWHWRSKLHFFGKVWNEFLQGIRSGQTRISARQIMIAAMKRVRCAIDWQTRIPAYGPLQKQLKPPNASGYSTYEIELLHFVRDLIHHINDKDQIGKNVNFDEAVKGYYSNEQFVEKMIGDIFPMFVVDLYYQLSVADFFVW